MKRLLIALGLIGTLGATTAPAQRVSVMIDIGSAFIAYHPRYERAPYVVYHPRRVHRARGGVVVVGPRMYRQGRVVVVRGRNHSRRGDRGRGRDRDRDRDRDWDRDR